MTEMIPKERISECIVEEIGDVPVPLRRTHDSDAQEVRWKEKRESTTKGGSDLGDEDENKLEELKGFVVVEGDAEYIKKS